MAGVGLEGEAVGGVGLGRTAVGGVGFEGERVGGVDGVSPSFSGLRISTPLSIRITKKGGVAMAPPMMVAPPADP